MRTRHASLRNTVLAFSEGDPGPGATPAVGIDGWATPAWSTSDGVVVLNPSSSIGTGLRRRRITKAISDQLDTEVPRLADLLQAEHRLRNLLVTVEDATTVETIIRLLADTVRRTDPDSQTKDHRSEPTTGDGANWPVWVASSDTELLSQCRTRTAARLVDWATTSAPEGGLERRVAGLHSFGIDALALPHKEWSAGSIALCHRFDILTYGWGCEHEREMAALVDCGIDAIQTAFPERLTAVIDQYR